MFCLIKLSWNQGCYTNSLMAMRIPMEILVVFFSKTIIRSPSANSSRISFLNQLDMSCLMVDISQVVKMTPL